MTFTDALAATINDAHQNDEFSGIVTIRQHADDLFEQAYGFAHRGWKIPNEPQTRFRIASISKMFTAVVILQLVDVNKLALDDPVLEILGLQSHTISPDITIEHLLTMTAGIADWFEEDGDWEENWNALRREHPLYFLNQNADYLPLFLNKPPLRPAGVKHQYSNASYILLALVIEAITGLSYFDAVRQRVFAQAPMPGSDFICTDEIIENTAEGYLQNNDGEWIKNIYHVTPQAAGDGGASATASDLIAFSTALRNERLLSPALTHAMLSPQVSAMDEQVRGYTWMYGYANFLLLDDSGDMIRWGHTGEEDGVSCRLYYYPQHDLDVVILGNQSWCAGSLSWSIHDLIMEHL